MKYLITLSLFVLSQLATAQPMLDWSDLADVQFFEKFSNSLGIKYYQATFGEDIKELEGEEKERQRARGIEPGETSWNGLAS